MYQSSQNEMIRNKIRVCKPLRYEESSSQHQLLGSQGTIKRAQPSSQGTVSVYSRIVPIHCCLEFHVIPSPSELQRDVPCLHPLFAVFSTFQYARNCVVARFWRHHVLSPPVPNDTAPVHLLTGQSHFNVIVLPRTSRNARLQ